MGEACGVWEGCRNKLEMAPSFGHSWEVFRGGGAGYWRMSRGDTKGGSKQKALPQQWPRGVTGWCRRKQRFRRPGSQKSRFRVEKWLQTAKPNSPGFVSRVCSGVTVSPCLMLFLSLRPLHGSQVIEKFDYVFAENGTVQYKHGRLLSKQVSVPRPQLGHPTFPSWVPSVLCVP